jgi:cell division protein FtsQ
MRSLTPQRKRAASPRTKPGRKPVKRATRDMPAAKTVFGRRPPPSENIFARAAQRFGVWLRRPILLLTSGFVLLALIAALFVGGYVRRADAAVQQDFKALLADCGFGISEIHISGNNRTPPAAILTALGFAPGQSIFSADLGAARRRLLGLDWIASADVERRYPGAIFVNLVEKRPFALWQSPKGLAVVERDGGIVTYRDVGRFARLPKLVGAGAPGQAAAIVEAVEAHRAVVARVKAYQRVSQRRWNLILDDGVVVKLPETGWHRQLDALTNLIIDKGILERDIKEIDLRSPTQYFFVLGSGQKTSTPSGDKN